MGNSHPEKITLLELCNALANLPPNVHQNNNIKISELHDKISRKITEYRTNYKLYSDDDLLEYETIISLTERENVFYKKDSSGLTEVQYAFNSYLKAKIRHNVQIAIDLLSCFPSPETRIVARFCFDNGINYQNFLLYDKNKSIKSLYQTKIYTLYSKLRQISSNNKFDIYLLFNKDSSTIEAVITNPENNKRIKYVENVTPYIGSEVFIVDGVCHKDFDLTLIASTLKS